MKLKKIGVAFLPACVTVLWVLWFEHEFLPFQVLVPLLLMFIGGTVLLWRAMEPSVKGKQSMSSATTLILGVVSGYLLVFPINFLQDYLMRQKTEVLVKALGEYKREEGRYPLDISDVTPKYLNNRPAVWKGLRSWPIEYTKERDTFSLYISYGEGYEGWYDTEAKNWRIHQEWAGS